MATFENIVIRCPLYPDDVQEQNDFQAIATSRKPSAYSGAQFEFQFGLFKTKPTQDQAGEMLDISNFSGLPRLRIRLANAAGSILLDDTVAGVVVEKDPSCTSTDWTNGTKQHFRFYFPATTTVITAGEQYLVVYGPDGDVFGRSKITIIDPGTGAGSSPSPSAEGYFTKAEVNGKLEDKLDKQLAVDQPLSFLALNPVTGKTARITLQPIFDEGGPRLVHNVEYLD